MKVTILIQDFFGQGAQYAMAAVARGMVAKGVDVEILVSQVHRDLEKSGAGGSGAFTLPTQAKIVYLPSRRARKNVGALRRYLKMTDAQAVLSTSGPYHWCLRLASFGLRKRPMTVLVNHGVFGWDDREKCAMQCYYPWYSWKNWRDRFLYVGFDRILVVNDTTRQNYMRLAKFVPAERIFTVYNPVIDEIFKRKVRELSVHPWLINKECPTFVAAGAYWPYKDHMTLLRAFREVAKEERARVIIFGKGPLEKDYRKFISENHLEDVISVGGYTNNLPAEMKSADGFVLSSNWESFGIVIVEALACGLPVVSTDAPFGPREILKDGKFGTLVPVGDYQAMVKAVLGVVRGRGIQPPDESWKPYTLEAATDRYLAALKM